MTFKVQELMLDVLPESEAAARALRMQGNCGVITNPPPKPECQGNSAPTPKKRAGDDAASWAILDELHQQLRDTLHT